MYGTRPRFARTFNTPSVQHHRRGRDQQPLVLIVRRLRTGGMARWASTLALGRRHAPLLAAFYVTAFACFMLFSYGLELTRYYS